MGAATGDDVAYVDLFGQLLAYRDVGPREGPVVLLLHGLGGSGGEWGPALDLLAAEVRVVAPDLPGFGSSDKGRGDYSLGAFANACRDLLAHLGVDAATVVGHSMGGGVALTVAYQYPDLVRELVLVSSGGLGPEVTPLLRAATLPGSSLVMRLLASRPVSSGVRTAGVLSRRFAAGPAITLEQVGTGLAALADAGARDAFQATARSMIDRCGQRVSGVSRLVLARGKPVLLIHGDADTFIPIGHSEGAHAALPGSTLEVFPGAGHYPFLSDSARFARLVADHARGTVPA